MCVGDGQQQEENFKNTFFNTSTPTFMMALKFAHLVIIFYGIRADRRAPKNYIDILWIN